MCRLNGWVRPTKLGHLHARAAMALLVRPKRLARVQPTGVEQQPCRTASPLMLVQTAPSAAPTTPCLPHWRRSCMHRCWCCLRRRRCPPRATCQCWSGARASGCSHCSNESIHCGVDQEALSLLAVWPPTTCTLLGNLGGKRVPYTTTSASPCASPILSRSNLLSRQPLLRKAAADTLRHLAERDAPAVLAERIETSLFAALDSETGKKRHAVSLSSPLTLVAWCGKRKLDCHCLIRILLVSPAVMCRPRHCLADQSHAQHAPGRRGCSRALALACPLLRGRHSCRPGQHSCCRAAGCCGGRRRRAR